MNELFEFFILLHSGFVHIVLSTPCYMAQSTIQSSKPLHGEAVKLVDICWKLLYISSAALLEFHHL